MKKKTVAFILACALSASLLAGCTTKAEKKAQEYKGLGISQMENGDYEGAVSSFQKALDQSTGTIGAEELDLCYYKALALMESGDAEGAIEAYTALVEYDKDNWEVYYLRGRAYLVQGQNDEALADFAQANSLNKNDAELCVHIYEALNDAGLADSGQEYYDTVVNLTPSTAEEYYYVGDLYFLTGDYENAKANLLMAQAQGYDKALLMLGEIYASEGDSEAAQSAFTAYMEDYPDDAEALNEHGEVALSAGEYAEAVTYLESALTAADSGMEKTIQKNLIAAYEYSGDFESAYHTAKSFLKNYSDEEVEREYIFLKTRADGLNSAAADTSEETETTEEEETTDEAETTDETETTSDAETTDGTGTTDSATATDETENN